MLTDKEWLSQIGERWEDTEDDEDISELIPGKKKKGAGRKKEGTPESGEPAKRGRKRKKAMDEEVLIVYFLLFILNICRVALVLVTIAMQEHPVLVDEVLQRNVQKVQRCRPQIPNLLRNCLLVWIH